MRFIKTLGLAVVMAIAAMALLGAGTASAEIHLCKVNTELPNCGVANQYSLPLIVEAENKGESKLKAPSIFGTVELSCQKEHMKGVVEKEETTAGGKQQLIGTITEVKWEECGELTSEQVKRTSCIVRPIQRNTTEPEPKVNWALHISEPDGKGNGKLYVGPKEGAEQPGTEVRCSGPTFSFYTKQAQPEHSGEWLIAFVEGGTQGKIHVNQEELKGSLGTGFWSTQYELTNPAAAIFITE